MDDQAYLNSISKQVRPEKKGAGSFFGSKLGKIAIGCVVAMVLIMIFSSIFGGSGGGIRDEIASLKYHIDDVSFVIASYQYNIKSSKLRSSSASLTTVMSNTSRDLNNYLLEKYSYKEGAKEYLKIRNESIAHRDSLLSDLFNAKISGTLDRVYAHKISYEIELIMSEEMTIYNKVSADSLKEVLETSYNSLGTIYTDFADYSGLK